MANFRKGTVKFSKPATYNKQKRINVYVETEQHSQFTESGFSDVKAFELRSTREGPLEWCIYLPAVGAARVADCRQARYVSHWKPLREVKQQAIAIIEAAGCMERIEELRTANVMPEWGQHLKEQWEEGNEDAA